MFFFDLSFWQSFVSNLGATIIGVIIGIPIAIWLSRLQERNSEKEHRRKILLSLSTEIEKNQALIEEWMHKGEEEKEKDMHKFSSIMHIECWIAFSDGGELQWIKDPLLIDALAETYYWIRIAKEAGEQYFRTKLELFPTRNLYPLGDNIYVPAMEKLVKITRDQILKTQEMIMDVLLKK
jgi:hypothetical protein